MLKNPKRIENNDPYIALKKEAYIYIYIYIYICFFFWRGEGVLKQLVVYGSELLLAVFPCASFIVLLQ